MLTLGATGDYEIQLREGYCARCRGVAGAVEWTRNVLARLELVASDHVAALGVPEQVSRFKDPVQEMHKHLKTHRHAGAPAPALPVRAHCSACDHAWETVVQASWEPEDA